MGVWGSVKGFDIELFHKLVGERADGGPMAAPWTCSLYVPWKRKYVFLRQNCINVMICWMDMLVFWGNVGS